MRPTKPRVPTEPVVTLAEAARRLGISRQAVADLVRRRVLRTVDVLMPVKRLRLADVEAHQPSALHQARGRGHATSKNMLDTVKPAALESP